MTANPQFLYALGGVFLSSVLLVGARTWTDVKGRKIEAEIISKTRSTVTVDLKGKETEIPLKRLSQSDQDFVAEWKAAAAEQSEDQQAQRDANLEKYFNQEWPSLVSADTGFEVEVEEKDGSYIYRSPHYEFISDARLSKVPVSRFAVLFEATRSYVQSLPYASLKAHKKGVRYKVMLFESDANYFRAGAPEGSAGVYLPSKDLILVKFSSLGLIERGKGWALDYGRSNKTLPHEITHQLTDPEYFAFGARGWFSEGFAEYIAATPYRSGKFSVNKAAGDVERYATDYSRKDGRGRAIGNDVKVGSLEKFMKMSYRDFAGENGNFNYAVGALLVTYFNHYDGAGDAANLKNFLRALKAGKTGDAALEALLAGRTFKELEADVAKGWSKRGLKLDFN